MNVNNINVKILPFFVSTGSEKLAITGSSIVLEKDGCLVDDDEILELVANETLMLLTADEVWADKNDFELNEANENKVQYTISQHIEENKGSNSIQYFVSNAITTDDNIIEIAQPAQANIETYQSPLPSSSTNAEYIWTSYDVPWSTIPEYILNDCEVGKKSLQTKTTIIHAIITDMRQIKTRIPMKAFRIVANKMTSKYPKMFVDVDEDGVVLGDGCSTLVNQLQDRNNYLNRPHKRPIKTQSQESPINNKKQNVNKRSGCTNWDPPLFSSTSNLDNIYALQRDFINKGATSVNDFKEKWPDSFSSDALFWHFNKLTDRPISQIDDFIKDKYQTVFDFGKATKKVMDVVELQEKCSDPNDILLNILQIFAAYFKEHVLAMYEIKVKFYEIKIIRLTFLVPLWQRCPSVRF